jgi:RNA polymerase sigma-70 factor (ECF subfamily)
VTEDQDLVARLAAGEPGAWNTFVARDGPLVVALVRRALHGRGVRASEADVEDLVSEVFTAFLERDRALVKQFRFECSWKSWLAIVTHGRIGRWLRARRAAPVPIEEVLVAEESGEGPVNQATRSEEVTRLRDAVAKLPERDRLALQFFYEEKLSREEIGKILGLTAAHAGVVLDRARKKLRDSEG